MATAESFMADIISAVTLVASRLTSWKRKRDGNLVGDVCATTIHAQKPSVHRYKCLTFKVGALQTDTCYPGTDLVLQPEYVVIQGVNLALIQFLLF